MLLIALILAVPGLECDYHSGTSDPDFFQFRIDLSLVSGYRSLCYLPESPGLSRKPELRQMKNLLRFYNKIGHNPVILTRATTLRALTVYLHTQNKVLQHRLPFPKPLPTT